MGKMDSMKGVKSTTQEQLHQRTLARQICLVSVWVRLLAVLQWARKMLSAQTRSSILVARQAFAIAIVATADGQ